MATRLPESVCGILIDNEFSGLYHGNLYAYLDSFESKYIDTRGSRILLTEGDVGKAWSSSSQKLHVRAELMTVEVSLLQAQISQRDLSRIAALSAEMGSSLGLETRPRWCRAYNPTVMIQSRVISEGMRYPHKDQRTERCQATIIQTQPSQTQLPLLLTLLPVDPPSSPPTRL
jgi:hypothetical protein